MGAGSLSIAEPQRLVMNEWMNKWKKPGTFHLKILELLIIHSTRSFLYFVLLHWTLLDLSFYRQKFRKLTVPFLTCCCEGKNNLQSHLWIKYPRNSRYNSKSWEKFMGSNTVHIGSCSLPSKTRGLLHVHWTHSDLHKQESNVWSDSNSSFIVTVEILKLALCGNPPIFDRDKLRIVDNQREFPTDSVTLWSVPDFYFHNSQSCKLL